METPGLKRYLPRSLFGRAALILVLPVVILQVVISIVFIQRYVEDVTQQMVKNLRPDLVYLLDRIDAAPDVEAARRAVADPAAELGITVLIPADGPRHDTAPLWDISGPAVIDALREAIDGVIGIDASQSNVAMLVDTDKGDVGLRFLRRQVSAPNPHQLLVLMVLTGALMTLVAYIFLRNQLRPIKRMAEAAEAFGRGRHVAYKPSGATEVRSAGIAFLDMRDRIERHIEQRTLMLSGVSHDLRTPLTRMRLQLGLMEENEDTADLLRDVDEMQRLVDEFLSFARGDATETLMPVDPGGLVRDLVETAARSGQDVSLAGCDVTGPVPMREGSVRRALGNLIQNACRYGTHAWVTVERLERSIRIRVEDDGPGIPEAQRAQAVKPFARLDPARNQNIAGVGLGLSIAMDVARSHGGNLNLGQSAAHGGLSAELVLPR